MERRDGARSHFDRRRTDRRTALALGVLLLAAVPEDARADVFTRRSASGAVEATNQPTSVGRGGDYTLAFRSKGRVIHSADFRPGSAASLRLEPLVLEAAQRERLDPGLVRAVIQVESAFDERAVSSAGARGLMQLMPDTATRFGVVDSFDPRQNIAGGTRYLAVLLKMFRGDLALTVAAYNAGEGNVQRYGGVPPFRETRDYVRKIHGLLGSLAPTQMAHSGMMSFTPGSEARVSAALTPVAANRPVPRGQLYKWRDARGTISVAESAPPPGVEYVVVRAD